MNDWLENLAGALGEEPLTQQETGAVLRLARDVAHGVERRLAPLSAYLVGLAVGRRVAAGEAPERAFRAAVGTALRLVPTEGATASPSGPPDG
jgi:Domain of unknown function (DUF6457)